MFSYPLCTVPMASKIDTLICLPRGVYQLCSISLKVRYYIKIFQYKSLCKLKKHDIFLEEVLHASHWSFKVLHDNLKITLFLHGHSHEKTPKKCFKKLAPRFFYISMPLSSSTKKCVTKINKVCQHDPEYQHNMARYKDRGLSQ